MIAGRVAGFQRSRHPTCNILAKPSTRQGPLHGRIWSSAATQRASAHNAMLCCAAWRYLPPKQQQLQCPCAPSAPRAGGSPVNMGKHNCLM